MLVVYGTSPVVTNWDSYLTVPTAESILRHGDLDLDEYRSPKVTQHYANVEVAGTRFDYFPWPVSLFALPAVAALDVGAAAGVGPGTRSLIARDEMALVQLPSASFVVALAATLLSAVAFEVLTGSRRRRLWLSFVVGLGSALATSAWSTASRALWQHGPSLLFLSLALLMAVRLDRSRGTGGEARRRALALGASAVAAYAMRPTNSVWIVVLSVWMLVSHRRLFMPFAAGAVAVAAPFFVVNLASFHRVLPPYYAGGRLDPLPNPEALAANLVSPSRGLLVFSPILLLAVAGLILKVRRGRLDGIDVAVAACAAGQLVVVSTFPHWWAGHALGPRFMTEAIPALVYLSLPAVDALAAPSVWKRPAVAGAVGLALLWSLFAHAQGAYIRASACWNVEPRNVDDDSSRVWNLGDPQVVAGIRYLATHRPLREAFLHPCPHVSTEPSTRQ